ncbi:RNA polymerase sigma factor [Acidiluteibacter ferrifornacis]|uniref:Sigma-70 family RNA polymerase sigma factor n=1 Tax=Acidiluteibacter ferrifornacis TaxID=2692424 RepID=A0A6N9NIU3_9FLAO|nr:RNA polymerase sigma factor [Acidiluteibacter ferrifornacis]NBG65769.1 sigma-70 family RNA polymerase sigma factor [Acidiluteibacter ferrifornacis]
MEKYQTTFLRLYEPVHEAFARFCHARAYGLMEAEDLISESILCALEQFHQLKEEKAFLSYLFSIATNLLNKKNRRLKFGGTYNEKSANLIKDESLDAETRLDIQVLYEALNTLPINQKEALILFEISGFSIREVCEIQKSSESAVKQRLKRGRVALANYFKSDQLKGESIDSRSSIIMSIFL